MGDEIHLNQQILARIARLERQNRNLKRGALAVLVSLATLFVVSLGLMGQTTQKKAPAPKTAKPAAAAPAPAPFVMPANIEAQSFILKDANGHVRAELYMDGEGPTSSCWIKTARRWLACRCVTLPPPGRFSFCPIRSTTPAFRSALRKAKARSFR